MTKRACTVVAAVAAVSLAGIVPAAQAELRVGKNYRLASDASPFRGKDAVSLAVDPANPQHIVEVDANYLSQECEYTVSRDGGRTWSAATAFKTPAPAAGEQPFLPTCGRGNHLSDHAFQSVAFGSGQNVYAVFAVPRAIANAPEGESGQSVLVGKSADGGTTFAPAVVAMAGGSGSGSTAQPSYELPSVAVDPGQGSGGTDRVIAAAREIPDNPGGVKLDGDASIAVSDNGAASFSPTPVQAETAGEDVADAPSPPVVRPDHSIAVAYRTKGASGLIKVATGTVSGQTATFAPAVTAAGVTNVSSTPSAAFPNTPSFPDSAFDGPGPATSSGSSFPRMAVDKGSGRLYLVYNQGAAAPTAPPGGFAGADHFIPPDSDVYLQSSPTGTAWSQPKLINEADKKPGHESPYQPPAAGVVTQTRHPDVSVASNGRVDIVWQDRRHWYRGCVHTHLICNEARLGDTYYAFSNDQGTNFSKNKRISDRSHNNDVGYDYRYGTGWAFGPVMAHMGNSQLLVGWMDSREGNTDNDNQDIYLAKVDHAGPADVPQESVARSDDPADTSVGLSKHTYPGGGEGLLASTFANRKGTKVVIANENDPAAVLAAGVLARANLSQMLLSPAGGLPASVKAEVTRMDPAGAYVVGDSASLSNQVAQDLQAAGVPNNAGQIERLDGANGAAVAAAIARKLDRRTQRQKDAGTPAFNAVTIVNPDSPDASAVSALAAARRLPVLFASQGSVPQETNDAITALGVNEALIVGGSGVVSDAAVGQLPGAVTTQRLGGADQYATSRAVVAESLKRGLPDNIAYVADGSRPIDGALLGSTVGRVTGLLMLSPAPLSSTAAGTADANGLSGRLDRLILLQPAAVGPRPGGGGPIPPKGCNSAGVKIIGKTNSGGQVIQGTNGNDRICGTSRGDVITGKGGKDVISGGGGNDRINGGSGSDRINGNSGKDLISGSSGNDSINGSSGNDRINGNSGKDRVTGGSGNDRLNGSTGSDVVSGSSGKDVISGSSGNDRLSGNSGNDRINGNSGKDRVTGGSGNDRLNGSTGSDVVSGSSGKDVISGSSGSDRLSGNSGNDRINGNSGNDRISGGSGSDRLKGGSGNDRIDGGAGRDRISGGSGRNKISQ